MLPIENLNNQKNRILVLNRTFFFLMLFSISFVWFSQTNMGFSQSDEYHGEPQILQNVAKDFDPSGFGYDVLYTLEGTLEDKVIVNPEEKSITFFYDSKGIQEDVLIIELPKILIDTPGLVFVDGVQDTNVIVDAQGEFATMYIPLFEEDKEITIIGSKVIPEFGSLVFVILIISIITIIGLGSFKKFSMNRI